MVLTVAAAPVTEYNTGFFSTPSDIESAAVLANATVQNIDGAVSSATGAPANWVTGWTAFKATWDDWYANKIAGRSRAGELLEWFTSDLAGELQTYEGQIAAYGAQLQTYGGTVPGGVPQPQSNGLPSWFPTGGTLITVGIAALLLVVAWRAL